MTEFMKTLFEDFAPCENSHMHCDFTTPNGLKITPSDGQKREREESEKKKIRMQSKKQTDIPFNFWIVYFGDRFHKCRHISI